MIENNCDASSVSVICIYCKLNVKLKTHVKSQMELHFRQCSHMGHYTNLWSYLKSWYLQHQEKHIPAPLISVFLSYFSSGIGPSLTDENLIQSLAASLHLCSYPIAGQTGSQVSIFVYLNTVSQGCPRPKLKVPAMIPYFKFHFFPHLLIFLQFRDPSCVLNLSTKAVLQKWHI